MSSIRILSVGLAAVLALALASCSPQEPDVTPEQQVGAEQRPEPEEENGEGGGEEPAGETVTFVAVDIAFEEAPSEVPAGSVTFELVNDGGIMHNVVVDDLGEKVVEAQGGETATGTVELEPGEYRYHCDVPGHESGMNGTFTVS